MLKGENTENWFCSQQDTLVTNSYLFLFCEIVDSRPAITLEEIHRLPT